MKTPMVGSHIEMYPYEGNTIYVFNKNSGKTYCIGEKESRVLELLDGIHSIEDIVLECSFYTNDDINKLIEAFTEIGLFESVKKKKNYLKLKRRLFNPNTIIKSKSTANVFLFRTIMIGCPCALIIGLLFNALHVYSDSNITLLIDDVIKEYMSFGVKDILIIYGAFFLCLIFHELAHTITARYYGVNVPEIGLMLYFLIPCAYTNISGIHLLKSKKEKMIVLASGNILNMGIIGVMYAYLWQVGPRLSAYFMALIILNIGTIFMNGMVFLKFDGYYMLEVLLDETQLKEKANKHLIYFLSMVMGKDKEAKEEYYKEMRKNSDTYLRHCGLIVFALISYAYIPVVLINSVLTIINMF